jgi:hypothetical protein
LLSTEHIRISPHLTFSLQYLCTCQMKELPTLQDIEYDICPTMKLMIYDQ